MPEPTPPEAVQESSPRRGKWRRRVFRGVLVLFVLLVLFHQPLLRWGVRLAAIRLAARENVRLSLEIEGSVWTNLTLKNVRAVPTGVSPVESITIERLRIEYSLQT